MTAERRPWIVVYFATGIFAAFIAGIWNVGLTRFFAGTSARGAIALFLLLPLLVILTRPVFIRTGARVHRGIGLLAAFRRGRMIGFLFRSVAIWIGVMVLVAALMAVTYSAGAFATSAAISNWVYVVCAIVLIAHMIPDSGFIAAMARPMTVYVAGAPGSGKTTFIGVTGIDSRSRERAKWTLTPSDATTELTASLHRSTGQPATARETVTGEYTIVPHRPWSQFIGARPIPLIVAEMARNSTHRRSDRGRTGFVITMRADDSKSRTGVDALRQQLASVRKFTGSPASRIKRPVALVLTAVDQWSPFPVIGPALTGLLEEHCAIWKVFSTTSQMHENGSPPEAGELVAAGQLTVLAWLVTKI